MLNLKKFFTIQVFMALILIYGPSAMAQDGTIYPLEAPEEPNAIPLGTGSVDDQPAPETWFRQWGDPMARNISTATLTPFLPEDGKGNGTAVIVAPGGGFSWLSMGNEGWEVGEALAKQGIAAFVLKYRLNPTPESLEDFSAWMNRPRTPAPAATSDASTGTQTPRPPQRDLSNQLEDAGLATAGLTHLSTGWKLTSSSLPNRWIEKSLSRVRIVGGWSAKLSQAITPLYFTLQVWHTVCH